MARGEMMLGLRQCRVCLVMFVPMRRRGRPPVFCSPLCRVASRRGTHAWPSADLGLIDANDPDSRFGLVDVNDPDARFRLIDANDPDARFGLVDANDPDADFGLTPWGGIKKLGA